MKFFLYCVIGFSTLTIYANDKLIRAVHLVETSGKLGAIKGDGGLALGPLQIHRGCWKDAVEFDKSIGGKYEDCKDLEYSKKIFLAYQRRYAKFTRNNPEQMARLWNGGLGGIKTPKNTNHYWNKVKKHL